MAAMNQPEGKPADKGLATLEKFGVDSDEAVDLLRVMVDTPSPTGHESTLAQLLAEWCRDRGLRARLQPLGPGRANVIAKLEGTGPGPSLLLDGHMDTSYTLLASGIYPAAATPT